MWVFVGANDKVYDGLTDATATFLGDPTVGGTKDVSLTGGTISFADKNVGPAKPANFTGYSITGTDAGIYALFESAGSTTGAITPAPLTVTADDGSKVYRRCVQPGAAPRSPRAVFRTVRPSAR